MESAWTYFLRHVSQARVTFALRLRSLESGAVVTPVLLLPARNSAGLIEGLPWICSSIRD